MSRSTDQAALLSLRGLGKVYPGVRALHEVSFDVAPGTVHALLGANGAGKSTLIKILAGAARPDAGAVILEGAAVAFDHPHDAAREGIACLFQEAALLAGLTVAENLALGREETGPFGLLRRRSLHTRAVGALAPIAPHLDPNALVSSLRTSERQLVAFARALLSRPRLLILDEPTASMTDAEVKILFGAIQRVRSGGASVLYVTHRLEEVFAVADVITVLRDGEHVWTRPIEDVGRESLVEAIAGREVRVAERRTQVERGRRLLAVSGLSSAGRFRDISIEVHAGEVVALAGLVGAGRSEIAHAILGADPIGAGTVAYPRGGRHGGPAAALRGGIALVPEDRKRSGIVPQMSVASNLLLSSLDRHSGPAGVIRRSAMAATVARNVSRFAIRPIDAEDRAVGTLSGGNQQKVVLARAIESEAELLILDEPTAGVDVATKAEIHRLIFDVAAEGRGILLISSEMDELLTLADRILVLREGRMVREISGHEATSHDILLSALGEDAARPDREGGRQMRQEAVADVP